MTSRERVLTTFEFQPVDRLGFDLMEGAVWPALQDFFLRTFGFTTSEEVINFLDPDFRWIGLQYRGPEEPENPAGADEAEDAAKAESVARAEAADFPQETGRTYSKDVRSGLLNRVKTVGEIDRLQWPDPSYLQPADYKRIREKWPDHAIVFCPGWSPLFWGACEAFGMETALVTLAIKPEVFEAYIRRQHEYYMDFLTRGLDAAAGHCDICWLGDDYAGQKAMLISPSHWRQYIKPYLAEQVSAARSRGMYVLLHSCGAIRPILSDLADIGVNGLLVFQTTAEGMDARSIAADFGGTLVFYGGMDVQRLLSYGTKQDVSSELAANVNAFAGRGGYIAANSHHGVETINGENLVAMCEAARMCVNPFFRQKKPRPN